MKHFSAFLALVAPFALFAQITIDAADMPSAGDTMRYQNTTLQSFDDGDTGPGHAWHFESMLPEGEAADTAVTVGSTPFLYQFYFNNALFYPDWDADYALRGPSIDFQGVQLSNVYDYYKKGSAGFRNVGFGATINGVPASVQRNPIDFIYQFPLNYGDTDSGESNFLVTIPTLGAYGQQQMRSNEVDGWGTLYLPADTFEVLRVRSVLQRTDTIYIDQFGFGIAFPEPETIEYKWLAAGMDQPVLQVNTLGGTPTVVRFVYNPEDISTGGLDEATTMAPAIFPNPASDLVRVTISGTGAIELIDAQGRILRSVTFGPAQREAVLDVSDLMPGAYGVRRAGVSRTAPFVIAR